MNTSALPNVALQASPEPTNKVAAASNAAGGLAAVLGGVMAGYGGPAITEMLGTWGQAHPNTAALIVMAVTSVAAYIATKYAARAAAYNVLDKPNVAVKPVQESPLPVAWLPDSP